MQTRDHLAVVVAGRDDCTVVELSTRTMPVATVRTVGVEVGAR